MNEGKESFQSELKRGDMRRGEKGHVRRQSEVD